MATITNLNKIVDVEKLSYFKNKQDTANKETFVQGTELESKVGQLGFKTEDELKDTFVEQEEDKGLYPDEDAQKLLGIAANAQVNVIESIKINNQSASINNKEATLTIDIPDVEGALEGYTPTTELEKTYATKTELGNKLDSTTAANTYATKDELNKIGTVKGNATKSQLPTLATTANLQDIWCITDDNNHWYMFVGKGATGADENGFVDLGDHVDISGKLDTSVAEQTYTKKADLVVAENTDIDALFS